MSPSSHNESSTRSASQTAKQHEQEAQRINRVVIMADGFLAVIKLLVGGLTLSSALVADGVHSLADLLTDVIIMAATHFGRRAPDDDHPYGHGRIETMASLWLGVVLAIVSGALIWESLQKLMSGESSPEASLWAIAVTIIALVVKESLFHWTMRIAIKQDSPLLKASAWHSRSDSASSLIVLVGLIGTLFGWTWLDPLAALVVAILIAKISFDTLWTASKELVDTALPPEQTESLANSVAHLPELKGLHDLRARRLGAEISLDVHLQVSPVVSVTEAHEIGMAVTKEFREELPSLADITFHIDTENDRNDKIRGTADQLPLRSTITTVLDKCWSHFDCWTQKKKFTLHYHRDIENDKGYIDIEIFCLHDSLSKVEKQEPHSLSEQLMEEAQDIPWLADVTVWIKAE